MKLRQAEGSASDASLKEFYEAYWNRETPPPVGDPLAQTRLRLLRDCVASVEVKDALEAGCGAGDLTAALARDGITATGIDISDEAVARAARAHATCRFVQHDIGGGPWPVEASAFDLVVSFEVIEHLLRPRELLLGASAALRDGGHLAITTPHHGAVKNLAMAVRGFDRHFDVEGEHIRFFSDRALRKLLHETGFDVLKLAHFGRCAPLWAGVFVWARKR
jgi:2-polyprenyl-3-methyl-5-hydroxy-6-metoxy-1,4-benzoquinol methylase